MQNTNTNTVKRRTNGKPRKLVMLKRQNQKPVRESSVDQIATSWGEGREEVAGFVVSKCEIYQLAKHWYRTARDIEFFWFMAECIGSSERRERYCADARFNQIAEILGTNVTDRAIAEVEREFLEKEPYYWRAFRSGIRLRRDGRGSPLPKELQPALPKSKASAKRKPA